VDCDIHDPPKWEGGAEAESKNRQMGGQAMNTEYRIAENRRKFYIEHLDGKFWRLYEEPHVPKYFDSLSDARSWVATIKRGVVYHDAEDATNLAQDERKAESGVKVSDEWEEHITRHIASLIKQRGLVNGISVYNVTVDDEHIRIST
jgi:hypothetical protein